MRTYTSKQLGDACEMLIAAELTFAGIPALKAPDNWPGYDVIAQPRNGPPQRISVKGRTYRKGGAFVDYYDPVEDFDWLAIMLVPGGDLTERRAYVVPRPAFDAVATAWLDERTGRTQHYITISRVDGLLGPYRDNFALRTKTELSAVKAEPQDTPPSLAGGTAGKAN